jgi:peptidoglycan/LPS O-acetylase OafA/YrhL
MLLLLLVVLPRTGLLENRHVGWPFIGLSFIYLSNVTNLFGVPGQYAALWSLAVEEHFYLLWPTAVRVFSRRIVAWCAVTIFVLCPILRAVTYKLGYFYGAGYTWLVADALAIGALLGVLSRAQLPRREPMLRFSLVCLGTGVALFGVGSPFGIWRQSTFCGGVFRETALNLFFAGTLGATLLIGTSSFKWIVRRPVLQWFGRISYGLYLIHMLAFDFTDHWIARYLPDQQWSLQFLFVRFIFAMGIAVGVAFLSRKYFEEWFLQLKDRWTPAALNQRSNIVHALGREPDQRTA